MPALKHIHTYKRHRKQKDTFLCIHPDCTHKNTREELVGKRAMCPYCQRMFNLTRDSLRRLTTHCPDCTQSNLKNGRDIEEVSNDISNIIKNFKES